MLHFNALDQMLLILVCAAQACHTCAQQQLCLGVWGVGIRSIILLHQVSEWSGLKVRCWS